MIARSFLARYSLEEGKRFEGFTPECEQLLSRHRWPGNVRELENVVRNIVVLNDAPFVTLQMLPPVVLQDSSQPTVAATPVVMAPETDGTALVRPEVRPVVMPSETPAASAPRHAAPAVVPLWQVERDAIESAIAFYDGNVPRAAAALEISPSTIYRKRQSWSGVAQPERESA
jgi:two-component system repressor protein LuxO